jgi:hypothetical protein
MRTTPLALILLAALAGESRAEPIAAAQAWWKGITEWDAPAASKKAPLAYAMTSKVPQCKKLVVGKATNKKAADKVGKCLTNAYLSLIPAEIDFTPTEDGWAESSEPSEMLFSKKQAKAIVASQKGATVLGNTFHAQDEGEYIQVWVAVGADDSIRGVWMISTNPFDD